MIRSPVLRHLTGLRKVYLKGGSDIVVSLLTCHDSEAKPQSRLLWSQLSDVRRKVTLTASPVNSKLFALSAAPVPLGTLRAFKVCTAASSGRSLLLRETVLLVPSKISVAPGPKSVLLSSITDT